MDHDYRKAVIRYWELRRIIFNVLLLADAWLGWSISNAFNVGIDDIPGARLSDPGVLLRFAVMFLVVNIAFCVGYVFDFTIGRPRKLWPAPFRAILLVAICVSSLWLSGGYAGKIAKEAAYTKAGVFGCGASEKP